MWQGTWSPRSFGNSREGGEGERAKEARNRIARDDDDGAAAEVAEEKEELEVRHDARAETASLAYVPYCPRLYTTASA